MGVYLKGFLIACRGIPATVAVSLIAIVIGAAFGLLLALCFRGSSSPGASASNGTTTEEW